MAEPSFIRGRRPICLRCGVADVPQARHRLSLAKDPAPAALCRGSEVSGDSGPRSQGRTRRVQRARTNPPHAALGWPGQRALRIGQQVQAGPILADGRVIVVIDRDNGEEGLEIWDSREYTVTPVPVPRRTEPGGGWGRFTQLEASPKGEDMAFANHRNELWLLDLASGASRKLRQPYGSDGNLRLVAGWPLARVSAK